MLPTHPTTITTTAPAAHWLILMTDSSVAEVNAADVSNLAGWLSFYSGRMLGDTPEVVASFRSALVAAYVRMS